ncbi:hypothetical protein [Streptomyces sp. NBC_01304]|uniref:hypothetical protein n=1 Tax=Streptomyces sp. NBC_01304 TaxID=2903818 RepID=UPI002E118C09|nr:hypothetical protein OG430_44760 [Streptomyces sp. NBC_01304]
MAEAIVPDEDNQWCGWTADTTCAKPDEFLPQVWASALATAVEIIWALSGRRFGQCAVALRPCKRCCGNPCSTCPGTGYWGSGTGWIPALVGGEWFNFRCQQCDRDACDCAAVVSKIVLPGPAGEIAAVWVDGIKLPDDGSAYRLYDKQTLVRCDGREWPTCQDLTKSYTEYGTWAVIYLRGEPVPPGGQRAVGILAQQLAKACAKGKCDIPFNVTQVTRDGVSWEIDPAQFYAEGKTGISGVDQWLSAVNPKRQLRKPGVYSPDITPAGRVETWPSAGYGRWMR